jgi:transposase InsO family protein
MSRKGNCTDNAPMESFFGHFKDEVDYRNCTTFEELESLTAAYIEYYNERRSQWNLGKLTPKVHREHLLARSG